MKRINDLNLNKKRVLIRADLNVPIDSLGIVKSNFRIKAILPTIEYCLSKGSSIILMSHLGRPNGVKTTSLSLKPIIKELRFLIKKEIFFSDDCISDKSIEISKNLLPGEIHLLENLRFHKEENLNDVSFAEKLSNHGDIYINDAFGTAHRKHASNIGVLNFFDEAAYGLLCEKELKYFKDQLSDPDKPYTVILGGAKVVGKIDLIENLMKYADNFLIGGAMANPFLKVKGLNIGSAKVDIESLDLASKILQKAKKLNVNIFLPVDVIACSTVSDDKYLGIKTLQELDNNMFGADIGPKTCENFNDILNHSKTVFWNGPVGIAETLQFSKGTKSLASTIKHLKSNSFVSIIGGGDTASTLINYGFFESFSHISTGGGASIHLLSGKSLPAFTEMEKN